MKELKFNIVKKLKLHRERWEKLHKLEKKLNELVGNKNSIRVSYISDVWIRKTKKDNNIIDDIDEIQYEIMELSQEIGQRNIYISKILRYISYFYDGDGEILLSAYFSYGKKLKKKEKERVITILTRALKNVGLGKLNPEYEAHYKPQEIQEEIQSLLNEI